MDPVVQQALLGVGAWLAIGVAFCFGAVALARSKRSATLWWIWLVSIAVIAVAMERTAMRQPNGQAFLNPLVSYYMLAALLGIPTAGALAFAIRQSRRESRRTSVAESLLTSLVFLVLLPVAAIVAMIPDLMRFFS